MTGASIRAANRAFLRACTTLEPTGWDGQERVLAQLDAAGWDIISQLAVNHGLVGMVARSLGWAQERFGLEVPILDQLSSLRRAQLAQMMMRRNAAREAGDALASRNIRFVIYKGAVLNEEVYGDLSLRSFSDCDILVPADQFEAAYDALAGLGYSLSKYECIEDFLRPQSYEPGLANEATLRHPRGFDIDLHWAIMGQELLPRDPDVVWRYCEPPEAPHALPGLRLSPALTLINSATHLYAHNFQEIKPLVDFYVTAVRWGARIEMHDLIDTARAMEMLPMVDLASQLCNRLFAPHPLVQRLMVGRPTLGARIALATLSERSLHRPKRLGAVEIRLRRLACSGMPSAAALGLRTMIFPSARELEVRFRQPFKPSLYLRYYGLQVYRMLSAQSNLPFAAHVSSRADLRALLGRGNPR
jgi:hypothetical protein